MFSTNAREKLTYLSLWVRIVGGVNSL